ncbi:hypothetical protein [Arcicella rosea]|uniref:Dolichyl-phosphate-mannose-protein mannosyltransferase n=1 Tax=Arcicella rosea TaxID=502909 RepID=A0A841EMJ6_9BACT|nr:hypothetical protein [Arcicella rosea]MBB6001968.1 hypothetical protein [Arcicella rosea]
MKISEDKPFLSSFELKIFGVFFIILFVFYTLLITLWNYTQISDFKNYYDEGVLFLATGEMSPQFLFFQAPGHPFLISKVFNIFHSVNPAIIQFLNICQYLTAIILTHFSFKTQFSWIKYIGTVSLSICVSYLSLMGFLAAEFNFLFFFVIGNFLLIRYLQNENTFGTLRRTLLILAIAFTFGLAQFVRPLSFYYLLFFGLGLFYLKVISEKSLINISKATLGQYGLVFSLFLFLSMNLYRNISGKWAYQPPQNGIWSIYVGFNAKAKGSYNAEDITKFKKIADPLHWNGEALRAILKPMTIERVKTNWQANIRQSLQRAIRLLVPYFTSYWFFAKSSPPDRNPIWNLLMKAIFLLSTFTVLISYFSNAIYLFKLFRKKQLIAIEVFAFCTLISTFLYILIHVFCLEIQPRYAAHLVFINLWILPLSLENFIKPNQKFQ